MIRFRIQRRRRGQSARCLFARCCCQTRLRNISTFRSNCSIRACFSALPNRSICTGTLSGTSVPQLMPNPRNGYIVSLIKKLHRLADDVHRQIGGWSPSICWQECQSSEVVVRLFPSVYWITFLLAILMFSCSPCSRSRMAALRQYRHNAEHLGSRYRWAPLSSSQCS